MVSNSAQLDRRTKQHTQFGVSASNGSRDMARTKSWWKKKKKNELAQSHIASPTRIANDDGNSKCNWVANVLLNHGSESLTVWEAKYRLGVCFGC